MPSAAIGGDVDESAPRTWSDHIVRVTAYAFQRGHLAARLSA
jgi:hypothetical protein